MYFTTIVKKSFCMPVAHWIDFFLLGKGLQTLHWQTNCLLLIGLQGFADVLLIYWLVSEYCCRFLLVFASFYFFIILLLPASI